MKKRIGSKLYDTERGIPVLPEQNLYKQPSKKTFYLFDGETITPVSYDEAYNMIQGAGRNDLLSIMGRKADRKGNACIKVSAEHADKLNEYSRRMGISQKKLLEQFIDSLEI